MKLIPHGHQCVDKNDIKEVVKVLKSDWITQGPKVKEFEDALCKYTGAEYTVAVSSGTAALHLSCLAAGISNGDEVITSPITFVASANCILYCGGKPVFADVQENTGNIDPLKIKKNITKKTKAIIPVHLAGHPCDLEEIHEIAKENNLIVIEDASHALGAEYKRSKIGSCKYSAVTTLSFHPVKHMTTGEGGAILTNRKDIYEKLLILRNHGITKDSIKFQRNDGPWYYEMQELGFNYRITDFQCALGISQLKKIEKFLGIRREIVNIYNKELSEISKIVLPIEKSYIKSSWHIYCMRVKGKEERKNMFDELRSKNIGVQVHYIPVYRQAYYQKHFKYDKNDFPKAEKYYNTEITLPIHPSLTKKDLYYVINNIKSFILEL